MSRTEVSIFTIKMNSHDFFLNKGLFNPCIENKPYQFTIMSKYELPKIIVKIQLHNFDTTVSKSPNELTRSKLSHSVQKLTLSLCTIRAKFTQ